MGSNPAIPIFAHHKDDRAGAVAVHAPPEALRQGIRFPLLGTGFWTIRSVRHRTPGCRNLTQTGRSAGVGHRSRDGNRPPSSPRPMSWAAGPPANTGCKICRVPPEIFEAANREEAADRSMDRGIPQKQDCREKGRKLGGQRTGGIGGWVTTEIALAWYAARYARLPHSACSLSCSKKRYW